MEQYKDWPEAKLHKIDMMRCDTCKGVFTLKDTGGRIYFCKPCQKKRAKHPQVETLAGFLVDEKLLPIMNCLIEQGIRTKNSCQFNETDDGDFVWIQFNEVEDFSKLVRAAEAKAENQRLFDYLFTFGKSHTKLSYGANMYAPPGVCWRFDPNDLYKVTKWILQAFQCKQEEKMEANAKEKDKKRKSPAETNAKGEEDKEESKNKKLKRTSNWIDAGTFGVDAGFFYVGDPMIFEEPSNWFPQDSSNGKSYALIPKVFEGKTQQIKQRYGLTLHNTLGDGEGQVWVLDKKILIDWQWIMGANANSHPEHIIGEQSACKKESVQLETQFVFIGDPCYQDHNSIDWTKECSALTTSVKWFKEGVLIKYDKVERLKLTIFSKTDIPILHSIQIETLS